MNDQIKKTLVPIIVSEFHLLKIQRELFFGDTVELNDPLLCVAPESLKPINIHLSGCEPLAVINSKMPISAKHQRIIASKFIGINNGASSHSFDRHIHQGLGRHVLNNFYADGPVALVKAENRHFAGSAPATFAFASSAEVALIKLDLSFEKIIQALISQDRQTDQRYRLQNSRITQPNLLSNFPGRKLNFKELDDPKPLLVRNPKLIKPSSGKIMKGVSTLLAPVSFAGNSIHFSASTACTKNRPVFPTRFSEEKPRPVFRFRNKFKGFKFH